VTAAAKLPAVPWADVAAKGGIRPWVDAELARQGLADPGASSSMSDAEKKAYKARRDEERRVRRELFRVAWAAYKAAHIVHLGPGVWWHDTADVDRFDAADPAKKQQDNALPALPDVEALAKALGLSIARLRWLSYHREVDTGTHYHRWTVPKRDGGLRPISAPKPELKAAQRWIARQVTEHLPVHGAAHGFLPGRSIATNAGVHAGAKIIVKLDIEGFYPTVTWRRVKGLLRKAGLGEQVATIMALVATEAPREELVVRGKPCFVATGPRALPQGAPTRRRSQPLCRRLDQRLTGLARKLGMTYTRYADDLTFSWHGDAARAADAGNAIGKLLRAVTGSSPPRLHHQAHEAGSCAPAAAAGHRPGRQPGRRPPRRAGAARDPAQAARRAEEPRARAAGARRDARGAARHGRVHHDDRPRARPRVHGADRSAGPARRRGPGRKRASMSDWQVHLEFEDDGSSKFWRARVEGGTLYVNYGKIGTNGQTQVKELGPDGAKKEFDKLVREKRKKGYVDAGAGGGDAGEGDDGEDEDEEEEAPPPKKKAAAPAAPTPAAKAGLEARLTLAKGNRRVATHLSLAGATVRMDAVETYASPEEARKAYYRLLATLAGEGHEEQ
jgi:predicted DNA-binding WGR domain protein